MGSDLAIIRNSADVIIQIAIPINMMGSDKVMNIKAAVINPTSSINSRSAPNNKLGRFKARRIGI